MADWRDHIESRPGTLRGRPVLKGTRITVEFILELIGGGWSEDRIRDEFPHLTTDAIRAAVQFAREMVVEEEFVAALKAANA